MAHEQHDYALAGVLVVGVYWVPKMSSLIQKARKLANQSPVPIGLLDTQVVESGNQALRELMDPDAWPVM